MVVLLMLLLLVVMLAFAATCRRCRSRNATARLLRVQCRSQGVLYAVIHVAQIEKLVTVLGRLRLRMIHGTRTTVLRWPPSLFRLVGLRSTIPSERTFSKPELVPPQIS